MLNISPLHHFVSPLNSCIRTVSPISILEASQFNLDRHHTRLTSEVSNPKELRWEHSQQMPSDASVNFDFK